MNSISNTLLGRLFKIPTRPGLRTPATQFAPAVEPLESRIAPASFVVTGTALAITLSNVNESVTFHTDGTNISATLINGTVTAGGVGVTGVGTSSATITSADFTTISITGPTAGESASFSDSGTNHYPQAFTVSLTNTASGNISFTGSSIFDASLNLTTAGGNVLSDAASSINLDAGAANLSITAVGHDAFLNGSLAIGGNTTIAAANIQAHNAANSFIGPVQLTGPAAGNLFGTGPLSLAASSFAFGGSNQAFSIGATGSITQSGAITTTGTGLLNFTSTSGGISLSNPANAINGTVAVGLSATGVNAASLFNADPLFLGNISLGTGALGLTATGIITQKTGTSIVTGGALNLSIDTTANRNVVISSPGNNIAGAITLSETNSGSVQDFSLHNANVHAALPTGAPFTNANDIRNLTLNFDNTGITLPGYSISGNLNVTAGGNITQSAGLSIAGSSTLTVTGGDFGIDLSNPANNFQAVSFNALHSTQPISVVNSTGLVLGASTLGRGSFNATATTGNITQTGAITQEKDALAADFTVTTGTSIALTNNTNDFTGALVFSGSALATLNVHNSDPQATFGQFSFPTTVTTLTVVLNNAPVILPSLNLATLSVNGKGITEQSNAAVVVAGQTTFNSNAFPIDLPNANNGFANLTLSNSGDNPIVISASGDLAFTGTSTLGSGKVLIHTTGNISETGAISQSAAATNAVLDFISDNGDITLTSANTFVGPVAASLSIGGLAAITNSASQALTLGNITAGELHVSTGGSSIAQAPGTALKIEGNAVFNGGSVTLANPGNNLSNLLDIDSTGNAVITSSGLLNLDTISVSGNLTVTSAGIIQSEFSDVGGTATFFEGSSSVSLNNSSNDFSTISVFTTGSSVVINNSTGLTLGTMQLGSGSLSILAGGNIFSSSGLITQTGNGAITLNTPTGNDVSLTNPANQFLGQIGITHSTNVTLSGIGNIALTSASTISGDLSLAATGAVTLPSVLTNLTSLYIQAGTTTLSSNVNVSSGGISFTGPVHLAANIALTAANGISFSGDVNAAGPLTLDPGAGDDVQFLNGTWNQGSNNLTILNTGVEFVIGDGLTKAAFDISSATISFPGGGGITVARGSAFNVGASTPGDVVTIAGSDLLISGNLGVGFGATNGQLDLTGPGNIVLNPTAQLVGTGLAAASATPVLVAESGSLFGSFANSMTSTGAGHDFFAGSDIVTPIYGPSQLSIHSGGVTSSTGTVTGFLPNGEAYSVTSSLGGSSGLATVVDLAGNLDIVVRGTSPASSKLTIAAGGPADTFVSVGNIAVDSPGAVSIIAPTSNFSGTITTAGPLASLVSHDLAGVSSTLPFTLVAGGTSSSKTSITAHDVSNALISLPGTLSSFTAVSVGGTASITAAEFGKIVTTGDLAGSMPSVGGASDPGNFFGNLTSTGTATVALTSAKISGSLGGIWNLTGSVGAITAPHTDSLYLTAASTGALNLGYADNLAINVGGAIKSVSGSGIANSTINAGSIGAVKIVSNPQLGYVGDISSSTFTISGNSKGTALGTLSVAGSIEGSSLIFDNGNVGSILAGQQIESDAIIAGANGALGGIKSISAADFGSTTITADAIGSIKASGNLAANLFGDFSTSTVTVESNTAGVGLGSFSATGNVNTSTFNLLSGSLTSFKVGQQIATTSITLSDPTHSALGLIQAGDWASSVHVMAGTIGVLSSTGVPASNPASNLLIGNMNNDTIVAYLVAGVMPGIGKISINGNLSGTTIDAGQGITSMTVGRAVENNSVIIADNSLLNSPVIGNIGKLTVGAWMQSTLSANTLGSFSAIGFVAPDTGNLAFQPGVVDAGVFNIHGGTPTKPVGVGSFTVAGDFEGGSVLNVPFGAKSITVGGSFVSSNIFAINPGNSSSAAIGTITVGELLSSNIDAGSISAFKTTGNASLDILGNISNSRIAITSGVAGKHGGSPISLGSLTVAGDIADSVFDAPDSVGSITVAGRISSVTAGTTIDAGYVTGGIGSLTAGAIGNPGLVLSTDIVTQSIASITVKGNAHRGFAGTIDDGFIDILGAATNGTALGAFSATGAATGSLFRVSAGDVGSFTVSKFISSDLLVGVTPASNADITAGLTSANWASQNFKIGSFTTTAPSSSTDPTDSAAFTNSNVIAAELGTITITGLGIDVPNISTFGIGFRTSAGAGAAGTVKLEGSVHTAPFTDDQFDYLGLSG